MKCAACTHVIKMRKGRKSDSEKERDTGGDRANKRERETEVKGIERERVKGRGIERERVKGRRYREREYVGFHSV